jgi:short-subunit dehydrogenase
VNGRTAIVTGAGRGIGAATAVALDAAGARVALVARSADQLADVAGTLTNDPVVLPADLGTPDGPGAAVASALEAFGGRIDVLVNNAGVGLRKDSETLTVEEMDLLWTSSGTSTSARRC